MGHAENRATAPRRLQPYLQDISAGIGIAGVSLPLALASGTLAYWPLGEAHLARGAISAVVCAAVGGLVSSLIRTSSFVITGPASPSALIQASGIASVIAVSGGSPEQALALIPLIVLLAGVLQILFGFLGIGRLVKYVPYPVVSGFVTGIAALLILKQAPRALGYSSLTDIVSAVVTGAMPNFALIAFGCTLLATLFALSALIPRAPVPLLVILIGAGLYHFLHQAVPGISLGPTLGGFAYTDIRPFDWIQSAPSGLGGVEAGPVILSALTLAIVGTIDAMMGIRAARNLSEFRTSPARDMGGIGAANLVSAFAGGIFLSTSVTLLSANHAYGGRTRLSAIALSAMLIVMLIGLPGLFAYLPVAVFPPLLLFLAWRLIDRYSILTLRQAFASDRSHDRANMRRNVLVQWIVLIPTAVGYPVLGVLVGFLLSCLVFIVEMSRPVVARVVDRSAVASKRSWSRGDGAVLAANAGRIRVFDLQGPMFFGNSEVLAQEVGAAIDKADTIVLNFKRVTDIDASAAKMLELISKRTKARGKLILASETPPQIQRFVRAAVGPDGCHATLDAALEVGERRLLKAFAGERTGDRALELAQMDLAAGASSEQIEKLARHVTAVTFPPGAYLCRQGEAPTQFWLIRSGSVSVRVGGQERRVACLAPGTTVGEMALIEGMPRSASVVADEQVEAYEVSLEACRGLFEAEPEIGRIILSNIARDLSARLRTSTNELRAALE